MAPIKEWFGLYNVAFKWIEEKYGYDELVKYWRFIAESCYAETVEIFKSEGLQGIRNYFEKTFELDDGKILSSINGNSLEIEVTVCPDYAFFDLTDNPYFKPENKYCEHHRIINEYLAEKSGYAFEMPFCDCKGKCKWKFIKK